MQNRIVLPVTLISVVAAIAFGWSWVRERNHVFEIRLATGSPDGEYYAFGQALADVVMRHHQQIRIEVLASEGSEQNMEWVKTETAELALVQSDTPVVSSARAIALLFPEMFHLIVADDSGIRSIPDLKGKRIALMPEGSGSYALFWPLSQHYGLTPDDFDSIAVPSLEAHEALRQGEVDALFRIIAMGNSAVGDLLRDSPASLLPIDQVEALQLSLPFLEATQIPKGTFDGGIPIPDTDLDVVAVNAMLIAHDAVPDQVIRDIAESIFEFRNELIAAYPRAALIRLPESGDRLGLPLHDGARAYYNQDQPSFLVEYAEPLGLLFSVSILALSGMWQLRLWLIGRQKNRADTYNLEILDLIEQVHEVTDMDELFTLRKKLFRILSEVVVDLDVDRISPESFQSFTFPWEVAINTIRHQETLLLNQQTHSSNVDKSHSTDPDTHS